MKRLLIQMISIIGALLLAWLIFCLILVYTARFAGISFIDANTLLSSIGSLMGAIFAVGGVIVTLVSVLTQIQLQDRITKFKEDMEKDFEQKIHAKYEKIIQSQVEGHLKLFKAFNHADVGNWEEAEELAAEALKDNPKLEGVYSYIALRMGARIISGFPSLLPTPTLQATVSFENTYSTFYYTQPWVNNTETWTELTPLTAIRWLEKALEHKDNPNAVSAVLSLLYGYLESYNDMIKNLKEAITHNNKLEDFYQTPNELMMLVYACADNVNRIQEVAKIINFHLPNKEDIKESILTLPKIQYSTNIAQWYAIDTKSTDSSSIITRIHIFELDANKSSRAYIYKKGNYLITIPENENPEKQTAPIDEILEQLLDRYFFICRAPSLSQGITPITWDLSTLDTTNLNRGLSNP
jgi:tetratricopeptide (TPR) repeat protein